MFFLYFYNWCFHFCFLLFKIQIMSQHIEIPSGVFPFVTEGAFDGKFSTTKPHCPPRSGLTWGFGIDFGAKHYYGDDQKIVDFFKAVGLHQQANILKKYNIAGVVGNRVKFKKNSVLYRQAIEAGIQPTRTNGSSFEIEELRAHNIATIASAKTITQQVNNELKIRKEQGEDLFLSPQQAIDITNQEWKRRMVSVERTIKRYLGKMDFYPPLKCPLTKALYGGNTYVNAILSAMKADMEINAQIQSDQERWIDQCNIIIKTMNTIDANGAKNNPKKYLINKKRGNIVFVEKIRDILLSGGSVSIKKAADDQIQLDDLLHKDSFVHDLFIEMKAAYVEAKKYKGSARNYTATAYRQKPFILAVKKIIGTTGTQWTIADDEQLNNFVNEKYESLKETGIPTPPVVTIDGQFDELVRQWLLQIGSLDLKQIETVITENIASNTSLGAGIKMLDRLETIVQESTPISQHYHYFIRLLNKGKAQIVASVGAAGTNNERDVLKIKALLANLGLYDYQHITKLYKENEQKKLIQVLFNPTDGLLIPAIRNFQKGFSKQPDGRVDPKGKTLRLLNRDTSPQQIIIETSNTNNHLPTTSFSPKFIISIQELKILLHRFFTKLNEEQVCYENEDLFRELDLIITYTLEQC